MMAQFGFEAIRHQYIKLLAPGEKGSEEEKNGMRERIKVYFSFKLIIFNSTRKQRFQNPNVYYIRMDSNLSDS